MQTYVHIMFYILYIITQYVLNIIHIMYLFYISYIYITYLDIDIDYHFNLSLMIFCALFHYFYFNIFKLMILMNSLKSVHCLLVKTIEEDYV